MRSFRSDNASGLCPEALAALQQANDGGHVTGYGDDAWTERAGAAFRAIFGAEIDVSFVATGTGANALAIAALTEPWEEVICHPESHWANHESTAPELITRCRTRRLSPASALITPPDLGSIEHATGRDVHECQPGVLTIANVSELGLLYTPDALRALSDAAHERGYRVHLDGARFANAVAAAGCEPAELAGLAGIDALSFGGTKNGLAIGEAVVLFPQGDGSQYERAVRRLPFLRKATGQLLSKHRFVSAPLALTLEDGAWLRHAAHANAMAKRLADALTRAGHPPVLPVDANHVFVALPARVDRALRDAGHGYYTIGDPERGLSRLVCSFDTAPEDIDHFAATLERASG
jgi:threonine aldolase